MSLPREHPPLKWMSNFKAVAIDYEFYLSLSDEPQQVCLTERQMYVLSVQNTYTYWLTRWYNTDDITQKTVEFIAAEIDGLLVMCNCGVPALTPTDVFNTINYVNNTTEIYNNTQNTWYEGDETVVSIAPNLDFDTGDPVNISKLICAAIDTLVRSILAQGQTMNGQTAAQNSNLLNVISSAMAGLATAGSIAALIEGVGAAAVALFGGPWMLLGLALGAVGLKIATLFMGADNSLFENEDAIAKVICQMQKNLDNEQVDRAAFMGALSPNTFTPGSAEAQIADLIQPFLNDLDTYLQFMVFGNQLYSTVTFAEMPDCGCDDENCEDLKAGDQGWTPLIPGYATYHGGEGYGRGTGVQVVKAGIQKNVTASSITIKWNMVVPDMQIGVFAGYNAFGSETFASATGTELTIPRSYAIGIAFEFLMGDHISELPSDLRIEEICIVPL